MRRRLGQAWLARMGVGVAMLGLVVLSAAPSGAVAAPPPGIKVLPSPFSPGATPPADVTFRSLRCSVANRRFYATARAGSWRLVVQIRPFRGYRNYEIEYGDEGAVDFTVYGPSNPPGFGFSNAQQPPVDQRRLTVGGGLAFPGGRSRLRLAFPVTYDGRWPNPGVIRLMGVASCRYPSRRG